MIVNDFIFVSKFAYTEKYREVTSYMYIDLWAFKYLCTYIYIYYMLVKFEYLM